MHVAGLLLGCLLFASASDAHRARSSDIVGEAMQLPAGSTVTGQRLTLLAAISSTSDRGQQLKIVRAYWRLVQAAADYTFCRNYMKGLELKTGGRGSATLRLAATAAAAELRDTELGAVHAQYELAELARLPANSSPPLPANAPLVLPYDTAFNQLFAGKTPPDGCGCRTKRFPFNIRRSRIGPRRFRLRTTRWRPSPRITRGAAAMQRLRSRAAVNCCVNSGRLSRPCAATIATLPTTPCWSSRRR